jgi:hypothetical protein
LRKNKDARTTFKEELPVSLEDIAYEDGIIIAADVEDNLLDKHNGAIIAAPAIPNGSAPKKKQKEKQVSEEIRLFQTYIKEIGIEPIFTPRKELEVAAKIKSCESRAMEIKIILKKLRAKNAEQGRRKQNLMTQNQPGKESPPARS